MRGLCALVKHLMEVNGPGRAENSTDWVIVKLRPVVMYTVLSSLAACGCLGVAAAAAGVFVCHA